LLVLVAAAAAKAGRDRGDRRPGEGISFANWRATLAAHVGRLLAYALAKDAGNAPQRQLIKKALEVRPLPDDRFGVAPTLKGLAGTWAMDPKYATKLVGVARRLPRATADRTRSQRAALDRNLRPTQRSGQGRPLW
jgi:hypothetical protein